MSLISKTFSDPWNTRIGSTSPAALAAAARSSGSANASATPTGEMSDAFRKAAPAPAFVPLAAALVPLTAARAGLVTSPGAPTTGRTFSGSSKAAPSSARLRSQSPSPVT